MVLVMLFVPVTPVSSEQGGWLGVEPSFVCVAPVGVELGCVGLQWDGCKKDLLWFLYWNRGKTLFI
jgi:hypothetical protein